MKKISRFENLTVTCSIFEIKGSSFGLSPLFICFTNSKISIRMFQLKYSNIFVFVFGKEFLERISSHKKYLLISATSHHTSSHMPHHIPSQITHNLTPHTTHYTIHEPSLHTTHYTIHDPTLHTTSNLLTSLITFNLIATHNL